MIVLEKIVNEDGTEYNPPKNPLYEKWERLYPGCESTGYTCMFCGSCPHGEYWKVPDEDAEVYNAYLQAVKQYNVDHGNGILPRIIFKQL